MEKKLILVSHGNFCVELKKSVEMIMGPQDNILAVPLLEEEGKEEYKEKLLTVLDTDGDYVILADLKGGTPGNVAAELLLNGYQAEIYTGMNMPMVIDYINSSMLGSEFNPLASGQENIVHLNELLAL